MRLAYVTEDGGRMEEDFDMAVLSVGLEAPPDALELAHKFGIDLDRYNFARTSSFTPVTTNLDDIYVCGGRAVRRRSLPSSQAAG